MATVRGYRENRPVRDRGAVVSLQAQRVLREWHGVRGSGAVFVDAGMAEGVAGGDAGPNSITSGGLGLIAEEGKRFRGELCWAKAFRHYDNFVDHMQDRGLHVAVSYRFW